MPYQDDRILLELRELMAGCLSAASVDATLGASLAALGLEAAAVGPDELPTLVERAMLDLRIFCDPEELPALMLDSADFCQQAES